MLASSLELLTELEDEVLEEPAEFVDLLVPLLVSGVPPLGGTGRGRDFLSGSLGWKKTKKTFLRYITYMIRIPYT